MGIVALPACISAHYMCACCPRKSEEGIRSSKLGLQSCGWWESNLSPFVRTSDVLCHWGVSPAQTSWLKDVFLFYVCECFACKCVSVPRVCLLSTGTSKGNPGPLQERKMLSQPHPSLKQGLTIQTWLAWTAQCRTGWSPIQRPSAAVCWD